MLLQAVTQTKDRGFVRKQTKFFQLRKFAKHGGVKEGLFHGQVQQGDSLLHEVRALHGLQ